MVATRAISMTRTMPARTIGEYGSLNRCAAIASAAEDSARGPAVLPAVRGKALTADPTAAAVSNIVLWSGPAMVVEKLSSDAERPSPARSFAGNIVNNLQKLV